MKGSIQEICDHADHHYDADEYEQAIPLYMEVLELTRLQTVDVDFDCDISTKLLRCFRNTRQFEQAFYCCSAIESMLEKKYGKTSMRFALYQIDLASVLFHMGRLDFAEFMLKEAKDTFETNRDTKSVDYGRIVLLFADIENQRSCFEKQLEWLTAARTIFDFNPNSSTLCEILGKTVACLLSLNRLDEARSTCIQSFLLRTRLYGLEDYQFALGNIDMAMLFTTFASYTRGIVHLEAAVRVSTSAIGCTHPETIKFQKYLTKCYEKEANPNHLCNDKARFRMCANCDVFIDREPLLERGTDFLVCGYCHLVSYCSQACSDAYWPKHDEECGKPRPARTKLINILAPDCCESCLCAGATLRCSKCKLVRYCDAKCQKTHWKQHKEKCNHFL